MGISKRKKCKTVFGDDPDLLPPSLDILE